jgi:hypothetical protein
MSKARHLRAAPRIERRRPTRSPKPSIIVVCEGGKTEVEYLNEFTADHGNHLVDLQTIGGVGVPETIVDRAIDEHRRLSRYARRKGADSYDGAFSVWAMFDVDAHPKVIEARTRALSNSIRVAFSNPCIELWALLHFSDSDGPLSRSEAQDRLRRFMPDYHHSSNPFSITGFFETITITQLDGRKILLLGVSKNAIPWEIPVRRCINSLRKFDSLV